MTIAGNPLGYACYRRAGPGVSCDHCDRAIADVRDVLVVPMPRGCEFACKGCGSRFLIPPRSDWFASIESPAMTDDELRAKVATLPYFQRFELRPGVRTNGVHDVPRMLGLIDLPDRLDGLTVLDIGACDGAVSVECWRRGASKVISLDHPEWGEATLGRSRRECFEFTREITGADIQPVVCPLEELHPRVLKPWAAEGRFDIVLMLGVLYHLPDPLGGLAKAAAVVKAGGLLILETHLDCLDVDRPAMAFYPGAEFNDDPSNWTGPNPPAVLGMLSAAGLVDALEIARSEYGLGFTDRHPHVARGVFHARKPG